MELTNAVIIYFTIGVPFGILSAYLRSARLEPTDIVRVIYHLTFWPLILSMRAFGDSGINPRYRFTAAEVQDRRADREERDQKVILDGLNEALAAALAADELRLPFADAVQHPDPGLAAKCFQRRNINRLKQHALEAQLRFSKIAIDRSVREESKFVSVAVPEPGARDPRTMVI